MAKKRTIYDEVFELYQLQKKDTTFKKMIRSAVARMYQKEFDVKYSPEDWNNKAQSDKVIFLCSTIRDYMMKQIDSSKERIIGKQIDKYLKTTLVLYDKALKKYNAKREKLYDDISFTPYATEEENHQKYNELIDILNQLNPQMPTPKFEDWKKQPSPIRPIDYIRSSQFDHENRDDEEYPEIIPTDNEVNHIIIQCILKIIEEDFRKKVNIQSIQNALKITKQFEQTADDTEELLREYNSDCNIDKQEQETIIRANREYIKSKEMLSNLDFIEDLDD